MAYQKNNWRDYDETKTELQNMQNGAVVTPERLNHMETGIANSADKAEVTAQLQQTEYEVKRKRELEDLSPTVLAAIENKDTETPFNLLSIPQPGSVTPKTTDFVKKNLLTQNLFDKTRIRENFHISVNDGSIFSETWYNVSDYIEVIPNTEYRSAYGNRVAFYDTNGNFLKSYIATEQNYNSGDNATLARMSFLKTDTDRVMFVEGVSVPTTYQPYDYEIEVDKLKLDEQKVESFFFENKKLKSDYKADKENVTFFNRESINLFNKDTSLANTGINNNTGGLFSQVGNAVSTFVDVDGGVEYSFKNVYRLAQYGADESFIKAQNFTQAIEKVALETNTTQIRVQISTAYVDISAVMVTLGEMPIFHIPYSIYALEDDILTTKSPWKTWNVLGDSITARNFAYWSILAPQLGIANVRNYGQGGTSITPRIAPWDTNAMSIRYAEMDDDADLITVMGGTNDNPGSYDMPELGTMADRDTSTFYGACHVLFGGLVNKYPTKTIAVFTPTPRSDMYNEGYNLEERVEAIKKVCAYYAIPCLDLFHNSQLKPWNAANAEAYYTDTNPALHLNEDGYKVLARQMLSFLLSL